jgi:hypothetical protein
MWSDESSFTLLPTSGRVHVCRTPKEAYTPESRGWICDGLGSSIVVQYSVGPIITLQGGTIAREYVDRLGNQVHPMIRTLFPRMTMPPSTQLELFSHGSMSMKMNFNIFPGQHSHQI